MKVRILEDCDEVVSLAETKAYLQVTGTQDNDLIEDFLIPAARQTLEKYTGLSFGEKEIEVIFETYEAYYELPYGPVVSVDKVERLYSDGTAVELIFDDDYTVQNDKLYVNPWYTTRELVGIRVTYTAGFNEENLIPVQLRTAIFKQIMYNYDNRDAGGISPAAMKECQLYKKFWI